MNIHKENNRAGLSTLFIFFLIFFQFPAVLPAQGLARKVLFLGNSYTYVNNLPFLAASLAHFSGDSLYFDSYTPGGYTLGWQPTAHGYDPVSLAKISSDTWDFVVLQEQSQIPAIPVLRDSCMYPSSLILHDSVKSANPCSRVLFFLTWGRRFGGMQCFTPNYCSTAFSGYNQMQDSLSRAVKGIADSLGDWISPVGEAWRYVIGTYGMVLHDADDSHPNLKGSYLAACVFYDMMFGKPSAGNSFTAGLAADTALLLQHAADSVALGYGTQWNFNNDLPRVQFNLTTSGDTVFTHNLTTGAGTWLWRFGDGDTSALYEPWHVYPGPGTWNITLHACNDCFCDSLYKPVTITSTGIQTCFLPGRNIRLTGPDNHGILKTIDFPGNGTLILQDLPGKISLSLPVTDGRVHSGNPAKGIWIWTLYTENNVFAGRGKIIF
jgi:hypothetical protein